MFELYCLSSAADAAHLLIEQKDIVIQQVFDLHLPFESGHNPTSILKFLALMQTDNDNSNENNYCQFI